MNQSSIIFSLLLLSIICLILVIYYINKTSQLNLKRNRNKFSKLFESSNDLIIILNENFSVISANRSAQNTFGKKLKNKNSFFELFDTKSALKITEEIKVDKTSFIDELRVVISDAENTPISYSLTLVKWKEKKHNHFGVTLKDLTLKLLHKQEEALISKIYKISESKDDQFSFLHEVLIAICDSYPIDFGQVWIKNENNTFFTSNKSTTANIDFEEYNSLEKKIYTKENIFNNSEFKIDPINNYEKKDFVGIPDSVFSNLQTVITIPVIHLDIVPVSFLLFSKREDITAEAIGSLFNLLVLIGELNHKKKLAKELNNQHILLTEAEKISGSGSWSVNLPDFMLTNVSNGFKDIYQTNDKNSSLYEKVIEEDIDMFTSKIEEAILNKVGFFIEYRIKTENRVKFIHMRGIPKYDLNNFLIGYHGSITDVSMLKEKNIELELLNTELEAVNENLEQFTYIASHDLQEPLRKIRTFGNLLKEEYEEDAPGFEYVTRMQKASERMQTLISDLLDYSRVSRNIGDKEIIDLNDLVNEVLENFDLDSESTKIGISIGKLPENYPGYKTQLFQLFQNLLSNAIKFRRENTLLNIVVSSTVINKEFEGLLAKKYHEITITDNGIGLDTQYADKIFDMFQRLHSKQEFPGTGIGLAICKKITENHDGIIKVSSTLEVGSEFKIYLPIIENK